MVFKPLANGVLISGEPIKEKYQGIHPAPDCPACPHHSVKRQMFQVLACDEIGMCLTSSLAMTPVA